MREKAKRNEGGLAEPVGRDVESVARRICLLLRVRVRVPGHHLAAVERMQSNPAMLRAVLGGGREGASERRGG